MTHKYYELLGVGMDASKDDIKKAFRRLAVQHHPDKGGDPDKFKEIACAYEVLSDDNRRREYDQLGDEGLSMSNNGGSAFFHMDPHDLFSHLFGGGNMFGGDMFGGAGRGRMKRADQVHQLNVSLKDAYEGVTKHIRIAITKTCLSCKQTCCACQGRGSITDMRRMGLFTQMVTRPCDKCNGTGQMSKGNPDCRACNGKTTYQEEKKAEIVLPAGVNSGHNVNFEGLGEQIKCDGETPGNLIFQIVVESSDAHFKRDGNTLIYVVPMTFAESVVGKKLTIPHYAGPIDIDTSVYGIINPLKFYEIPDKGMPKNGKKSQYGKLLIKFEVTYPNKSMDAADRQAIKNIFDALKLV